MLLANTSKSIFRPTLVILCFQHIVLALGWAIYGANMKKCKNCDRESLNYSSMCREHHNERIRNYRASNSEKLRAYDRKRYADNPESKLETNRKWVRDNPEKIKARNAVNHAIEYGKLVREPCFCGNKKSEAHHEDYSKPLDVVWLCRKHHKRRHVEILKGNK